MLHEGEPAIACGFPLSVIFPPFSQWDKEWVAREDGEVRYWSGDSCELFGGATLYR